MLVPGWIYESEMNLHLKYMTNNSGKILEGGCASGRLFSFLYPKKPNWKFYGVNTWTEENVYLQKDWNQGYFEPGNLTELITKKMFDNNCPYAKSFDIRFENFNTEELFDVISIGQISKNINWEETYKKAFQLLNFDGVVIGRNIDHKKYGNLIQSAIKNYKIIDRSKQAFVLKRWR
jgi:hypothetical protein